MENIDLYDLAFAFSQRPEVSDARVATDMCPDDTVLVEFTNGQVAVLNMQDGYPAVALGMLYANADGIREHDPLESVHHDFEGEDDYGDGVDDLVAQCTGGVTTMDTVEFFRDRKWPSTDSRILEIPVAGLGNVAVQDWSMLDDVRFAGYLLPEPLRNRYFGLLEQDDDPPKAAWDAFMDDLWEAVYAMGPEEQADWFREIHDPATIRARYWVHDGIEYLDAAHTMPRDE